MKRYLVIYEGRIQSVGFRAWCQRFATQYNCTGWVRNMSNGMVEMQIQGEDIQIKNALLKIKEGNMFIRVDNVTMKEIKVAEHETTFEARYY